MLQDLLDAGAAHDAEFSGGLSNHRPMALIALKRLGADDDRLAAFAEHYSRRLRPAPPAAEWPAGDAWIGRLGDPAAWAAYRCLFANWIAHEGGTDVLVQVLPALMPGVAAGAFHAEIRTAYALQAGHAGELADGLAYWACRHLPLGPAPRARKRFDLQALLAELEALFAGWSSPHRLILERVADATRRPGLAALVQKIKVDETLLPQLARTSAQAYARSGNFTVLHLVTSAHATRVLVACCDGDALAQQVVGHYARAWLTAFAASGAAHPNVADLPPPRPWPELIAAAIHSDDDHLIKLVDSCREETRAYGGDDWQRAATRAVLQGRT